MSDLLTIQEVRSGSGEFIGFELTVHPGGEVFVVFADQAGMPGMRLGPKIVAGFGETLTRTTMALRKSRSSTRIKESDTQDAQRWRYLVRHGVLGFEGAPTWNAVIRLPMANGDDQTISKIVDSGIARESNEINPREDGRDSSRDVLIDALRRIALNIHGDNAQVIAGEALDLIDARFKNNGLMERADG